MTQNRQITLAGKVYDAAPLPIRHNRVVYPLCRKLVMADLLTRCIEAGGALVATDEELDDLITIAVHVVQSVAPDMTRADVEGMAITPPELLDMFFQVRYLTGAWLPLPDAPVDDAPGKVKASGEPKGARKRAPRPRK